MRSLWPGWLAVPEVSFNTGHSERFGLRQVYDYALGRTASKPVFQQRSLYKKVRHPMMLGFLIAFWAAPHATTGYLLFAGIMTAYILTEISFEERDLAGTLGDNYRDDQTRVPKLLPVGQTARTEAAPDRHAQRGAE